jgi:hypothetical protein
VRVDRRFPLVEHGREDVGLGACHYGFLCL